MQENGRLGRNVNQKEWELVEEQTKENLEDLKELIKEFDRDSLVERAERYDFLLSLESRHENVMFHGKIPLLAFEAAGNSYINAKFIGSVVLAQIVIEQSLSQMFNASGVNSRNWNFPQLLKEAQKENWITEEEHDSFDVLKDIRNPYVHYKNPLSKHTLMKRMIDSGEDENEVLEKDAKHALEAMYKIINKFTF